MHQDAISPLVPDAVKSLTLVANDDYLHRTGEMIMKARLVSSGSRDSSSQKAFVELIPRRDSVKFGSLCRPEGLRLNPADLFFVSVDYLIKC